MLSLENAVRRSLQEAVWIVPGMVAAAATCLITEYGLGGAESHIITASAVVASVSIYRNGTSFQGLAMGAWMTAAYVATYLAIQQYRG